MSSSAHMRVEAAFCLCLYWWCKAGPPIFSVVVKYYNNSAAAVARAGRDYLRLSSDSIKSHVLLRRVYPCCARSSWSAWRRSPCSMKGSCWRAKDCRLCPHRAAHRTGNSWSRPGRRQYPSGTPVNSWKNKIENESIIWNQRVRRAVASVSRWPLCYALLGWFDTYDHVNCQFKFILDDAHEDVLRDEAIFIGFATEGHEGVEIFVGVALVVIRQLLIFVPPNAHQKHVYIDLGQIFWV